MRGTLTQCKGSLLEAIFSGRWDSRLLRDDKGRTFLDMNPNYFRKILSFLSLRQVVSPDEEEKIALHVNKEDEPYFRAIITALGLDLLVDSSSGKMHKSNDTATNPEKWKTSAYDEVSGRVKFAWEAEKQALIKAREHLLFCEDSFQRETKLISFFLEDDDGIVQINSRGVLMATKRSTLGLIKDSALAKQFNDPKWASENEIDTTMQSLKKWETDQVLEWARKTKGLPQSVAQCLSENKVNGIHLLAMERDDFKEMGINHAGDLAVLMANIIKLQRCMAKPIAFIQHNPSCFGKIVDHLRLQAMCPLLKDLHCTLKVHKSQQMPFMRIVDYYFPGDIISSFFGHSLEVDSLVLSKKDYFSVCLWLQEDELPIQAKLLYRASRDGWDARSFHQKCDGQGASVTVVQSVDGYVFGGYSDKSWSSPRNNSFKYEHSSKAFLFVLRAHSGLGPTKLYQTGRNSERAVYHNCSAGPTFGGGYDLEISDKSNISKNSTVNIGCTYNCPSGQKGDKFITGSRNFQAKEIEVFSIS